MADKSNSHESSIVEHATSSSGIVRVLTLLSLATSFGLALGLTLVGLAQSRHMAHKLGPGLAGGDTRHIVDSISHLAILVVMTGALFAGAIYLPVRWVSERSLGALAGIPRGERLWFAAGAGMLLGYVFETTGIVEVEGGPLLTPTLAMLVVICTFGVHRPQAASFGRIRYSNVAGWIVSCLWSVILFPMSLFILMRYFNIDP